MRNIDNGDGAHVEYSIPPEIKKQIPVYFYIAFAGELFSIYGGGAFTGYAISGSRRRIC